ncbi:hypothetical protein [Lyngbya confervoides]|uniref:DUF2157 domain-containing protein n=1 Tax=Lyngbya confervoides BDU141951 TaxID=1574623 RepID=A0ABD4T778_9CYAN|nr:hypothetical protein [Lyngbya confervoides]MCM1984427.1 hypothetical protein [Lyngbya confervoides BDU141951]
MNTPDPNRLELMLCIQPGAADLGVELLEGLEQWVALGLLSETQLRHLCARSLSCPIALPLAPGLTHPNLLAGLDIWLRLGLISEEQMRCWSRDRLSVNLPSRSPATAGAVVAAPLPSGSPPPSARSPGWLAQILQALMDEISVLWLLFLGVFLVVVSSAILAASQWENVPPAGQYGILWGYTVVAWLVSHWLSRRANLQLTACTLQLTTLLIIPVNFWMIDAFALIQGGPGIGVALAAGGTLSGLLLLTLQPRDGHRWSGSGQGWLVSGNLLLLSWLHWGWMVKPWAILAVYLGIIATGLTTIYLDMRWPQPQIPRRYCYDDLLRLTPLYAVLLLLLRGGWIAQMSGASLGLAVGLVGGLWGWVGRRSLPGATLWWLAGLGLLLIARVMVLSQAPIQAVVITGLGLALLGDRLVRRWPIWILWVMFGVGLQGLWPIYSLIPAPTRAEIVTQVSALASPRWMPQALISLLGLPYLWGCLWGAGQLRSQQQPSLARQLDLLCLGFGSLLTLLCLGNPILRTAYLGLVTATLGVRLRRGCQSQGGAAPGLLALTHGVALGAIASAIDVTLPTLSGRGWAVAALLGMLLEWGVAAGKPTSPWQRSAWWAGLLLAAIAYGTLTAQEAEQYGEFFWLSGTTTPWTLLTWVIPLSLVTLGRWGRFPQAVAAQWLGVGAILAAQMLCLGSTLPRTVGLGLATGLMALSSRSLPVIFPAAATLGFALLMGMNGWLSYRPGRDHVWLFALTPLSSVLLLLLAQQLQRLGRLGLYQRACLAWSRFLDLGMVLAVGLVAGVCLVFPAAPPSLALQWGAGLTGVATLCRLWIQPGPVALYTAVVALEAGLGLGATLTDRPYETIALGTLTVGLVLTQIGLICPPLRRSISPLHWQLLSCCLAGWGWLVGHHDFLPYTGLYTLGAGLILLLVGRQAWIGATYLGLAATTFGVYELLVYQLLQQGGPHPGDALILLAGVAAAVALGDRLLVRWSPWLLRLTRPQFLPVAHLHWLLAGVFLGTALVAPMRPWAEAAWIGLMLLLGGYALAAGRREPSFVSAGIGQGLAAIAFGLAQALPPDLLGRWGAAMAVVAALGLFYLPWHRWGWEVTPGQRLAILLPGGVVLITLFSVGLSSVLLTSAWYFWVGQRPRLLRLSYLGIGLANWASLDLVDRWLGVTILWISLLLGGSMLLIVHLEPLLQSPRQRELRHWLRCAALGLMAVTALLESQGDLLGSLLTVLAGLILGGVGVMLQVRACLYVGTLLFMVKTLLLLWSFVADHSFLLWALGIALGLLLIWIAATFEARRSQAIALLDYWVDALQRWQ